MIYIKLMIVWRRLCTIWYSFFVLLLIKLYYDVQDEKHWWYFLMSYILNNFTGKKNVTPFITYQSLFSLRHSKWYDIWAAIHGMQRWKGRVNMEPFGWHLCTVNGDTCRSVDKLSCWAMLPVFEFQAFSVCMKIYLS